jgi:hypothetical protein
MSDTPKFAQNNPSVHVKVLPHIVQLPRQPRNFWGSSELPRDGPEKGKTDTD